MDDEAIISSVDHKQREGVAWDIILEAINTYDNFMLDDDYDAQGCLDKIVKRLNERRDLYLRASP